MATATRSPLVAQAEKIDGLARHLSEGRLLEKVLRLAGSDTVWRGPVRANFLMWAQRTLDLWVRNQLSQGLQLVARSLFDRAAAIEQAAQQMLATGQVGAGPGVPTPLNYTPGTPPPYGEIGGGAGTNDFNVEEMRNLSHVLMANADEVMDFGRNVDRALEPPPAPPPPPGTPPPINPLPPDAEAAVGFPQVYIEIASQLRSASMDIAKRADLIMANEEPLPTFTPDLGLVDKAASGAAAQAASSDPAADQAADAAQQPAEKPPPTEEEIRIAREEGEKLATKALQDKALEDPKELKEIAKELEAHKNDPAAEAYAAAFVKKFGPKNMLALPRAVHSFKTGVSREPKSAWEQATKPPPSATAEEKEDILYAFSATLATASHSEEFDKKVEDEIFDTDDKLALAWLIANPTADFDADFLVRAFEEGVIEQIKDELALTGIGAYGGKAAGELELNGTKLSDDAKLVVLDAVSRNREAAMRVADMDFDPPLTVAMGVRGARDVDNVVDLLYLGGESNNSYSDKGAALGRMLDSAHQGFVEADDAGNAKELVDRILGAATNEKEVAAARSYLREIGARHPMTDEESQKALDRVRRDPKHPGRELLLAQAAQSGDAANAIVQASTSDKWKEKALFETQSSWDLVALALRSMDTSTDARKAAEDTLEWAIKKIGDGKDLGPEARRGLALALPLAMDHLSDAVIDQDKGRDPLEKGLHFAAQDVMDTLKEISRDDQALGIAVSGLGGWASNTYANLAAEFDAAIKNPQDMLHIADVADSVGSLHLGALEQIGTMFCTMTNAVHLEGKDREARAKKILGFYQFGVNLAFDVVPGLKSIDKIAVKGHEIPGTAAGSVTDSLKENLAAGLSGINTGAIAAKAEQRTDSTEETLEHMVRENMMTALAKRPGFLQRTGLPLPDFMFKEPLPTKNPDGAFPGGYPESYLKREYLDTQGSVRLPGPSDETYSEFQDWCTGTGTQNESLLYNFAGATTEKVYNKMKLCLDKAMR